MTEDTAVAQLSYSPTGVEGYRKLNEADIAVINSIKFAEKNLMSMIAYTANRNVEANGLSKEPDQRMIAIAKTQLQLGFMALVRAIAQPN